MKHELMYQLEAAYAALVEARKIAALHKHKSCAEIGEAIERVEDAVETLHVDPKRNG